MNEKIPFLESSSFEWKGLTVCGGDGGGKETVSIQKEK